ncbi:MAG: hypothetical protein O2944_01305 [Proteobacteria bacterium]|nr:hypothetical protein [Pseudomonadota bacterium]
MPSLKRALAAMAVVLASAHLAAAGDAVMSAVSYLPLPNDRMIAVEAYDNSEETVQLQKSIEAALKKSGYTVSQSSRLVLSFEHRDAAGAWTGGGPNRLIELRNRPDHSGTKSPDVRLNIYDSNRGGLINPKPDPGITQVTPSRYRIDISIDDRSDGKRFWQAWSETNIGASDDPAAQQAMVTPLITSIGTTIRDKRFSVN